MLHIKTARITSYTIAQRDHQVVTQHQTPSITPQPTCQVPRLRISTADTPSHAQTLRRLQQQQQQQQQQRRQRESVIEMTRTSLQMRLISAMAMKQMLLLLMAMTMMLLVKKRMIVVVGIWRGRGGQLLCHGHEKR